MAPSDSVSNSAAVKGMRYSIRFFNEKVKGMAIIRYPARILGVTKGKNTLLREI